MMISKSVTSLTLLCLIGMLASPIDALELESSVLDSQRGLKGPKGVKAPKNGKTGKKNPPMPTTPIPTSAPVPDSTMAPKDPKDKKAKKDKQAKKGKTTKKKDEKTDAPVLVNAAFEITLPLCGNCDPDAATKLGASQAFISEMQIIVAASLDVPIDPADIDVTVDPDSVMCAVPCGDTRNLSSVSRDLAENFISNVVMTIVTPDAITDKVVAQNKLQVADYGKVGEIIITIIGPYTTSDAEVKVIDPEPSASSAPAAAPLVRSRYLGFIN